MKTFFIILCLFGVTTAQGQDTVSYAKSQGWSHDKAGKLHQANIDTAKCVYTGGYGWIPISEIGRLHHHKKKVSQKPVLKATSYHLNTDLPLRFSWSYKPQKHKDDTAKWYPGQTLWQHACGEKPVVMYASGYNYGAERTMTKRELDSLTSKIRMKVIIPSVVKIKH